jgi:peptide subunit release factor 1 (eRF1)
MLAILLTIILIVMIATLLTGLDFRDPNLRPPCPDCGGEMRHTDEPDAYQCKACGHREHRHITPELP